MNMDRAVQLIGIYAKCPHCGNDKIGAGSGTLDIDDKSFERTCVCGWKVKVEEGKAT